MFDPMIAGVKVFAGYKIEDGLPTQYFVFPQCDSEDMIRMCYHVGILDPFVSRSVHVTVESQLDGIRVRSDIGYADSKLSNTSLISVNLYAGF